MATIYKSSVNNNNTMTEKRTQRQYQFISPSTLLLLWEKCFAYHLKILQLLYVLQN